MPGRGVDVCESSIANSVKVFSRHYFENGGVGVSGDVRVTGLAGDGGGRETRDRRDDGTV